MHKSLQQINQSHMPVPRSIMHMINNSGSKSSLKVKLLQCLLAFQATSLEKCQHQVNSHLHWPQNLEMLHARKFRQGHHFCFKRWPRQQFPLELMTVKRHRKRGKKWSLISIITLSMAFNRHCCSRCKGSFHCVVLYVHSLLWVDYQLLSWTAFIFQHASYLVIHIPSSEE